uniref:CSON006663 protein n=1 Tax=Culicoides sonorensis TaxID=179676 RepID=A0A336L998_CULSO
MVTKDVDQQLLCNLNSTLGLFIIMIIIKSNRQFYFPIFCVYRKQLCITFLVFFHFHLGLAILHVNNSNNFSSRNNGSHNTRPRHGIDAVTEDLPITTFRYNTTEFVTTQKPAPMTTPTTQIAALESIRLKCTLNNFVSNPNCTEMCNGMRYSNWSVIPTVFDKVINELFTQCPTIETLSLNNSSIMVLNENIFTGAFALKELYLTQNNIREVKSETFDGAYHLSVLDLSKNLIEIIAPDTFKKLTKLMTLDLSENKLKTLDIKLLQDCTSLSRLVLKQNQIINLELHFTSRILQLIDVSSNNLINVTFKTPTPKKQQNSFPRNFSNVTLLLDNNNLRNLTISPAIQIYELSLAHNGLKTISELSKIRPFLARILNLEDNNLTYLDPKILPVSSKLEILKLKNNELSELDVMQLSLNFINLKMITLTDNDWNCKDLKRIVTQLEVRNIEIIDEISNATDFTDTINGIPCFDPRHVIENLREEYYTKLNQITLISVCVAGFLIILMCFVTISSCRTLHRIRSDSLSKSFEIKMMPSENIYEEHVYNNVYSNPTTPTTTL